MTGETKMAAKTHPGTMNPVNVDSIPMGRQPFKMTLTALAEGNNPSSLAEQRTFLQTMLS
jgi:hypothetical protein